MERCKAEREEFRSKQVNGEEERKKKKEEEKIWTSLDRTTTSTHLASVPERVLSGIVRLGLRPGRTTSQHAGGRRFA